MRYMQGCRWRTRIFGLVAAVAILLANGAAASACNGANSSRQNSDGSCRDVVLYTEDFPPFNYLTGTGLKGVGADVVRALSRQLGLEFHPRILPWKRVIQEVRSHPLSAAFSMVRTPERETEYKWVGPIATVHSWLYQRADSKLDIKTLDDARKVTAIGVQAGGAAERSLRAMGFTNLSPLFTPGNALRLLIAKRIDLWESADVVMTYQSQQFGIRPSRIKPVVNLGQYDLYLAFSKEIPDAAIRPWRDALAELRADGTLDRIQRQYGIGDAYASLHKMSLGILD